MRIVRRLFLLMLSLTTFSVLVREAQACTCIEYGTPPAAAGVQLIEAAS